MQSSLLGVTMLRGPKYMYSIPLDKSQQCKRDAAREKDFDQEYSSTFFLRPNKPLRLPASSFDPMSIKLIS